MPDLNDVYRGVLTARPPNYTDHMLGWLHHYIRPFRLRDIRIFLQPDFINFGTTVIIEARSLPGLSFRHTFQSRDFIEDQDSIARTVAWEYSRWLNTLYVPPGDNIELGEN